MFKNFKKQFKTNISKLSNFIKKIKILFSKNSDLYILEQSILMQLNKMDEVSKNISKTIPINFYLKELRTLSVQLPRRMGNTTLAVNISKHFPNSVYIVHNAQRAFQMKREFGLNNAISYEQVLRGGLKGKRADLVIIDECGFFNDLNEERLYENFYYYPYVKILKVGQL